SPPELEREFDAELRDDSERWLEPALDSEPELDSELELPSDSEPELPSGSPLETDCSGSGRLTAEAGGSSVPSLCTPITLHVAGPTTPSVLSPCRACRRWIAASVSG